MEEEPTDPYEQQLLGVFKSCLAEGQSQLDKDGLLALCNKLELEVQHRDAILQLLDIDTIQNKFISFSEFRNKFLQLLGKSQEGPVDSSEQDVNGESLSFFGRKMNKTQVEAMNSDRQQSGNVVDYQRWQETWSNQNSLVCEDVNNYCTRGAALPKQTIELIFEKLDIDCDGLINIEEFTHFFQTYNNNKPQEQSNINWSTHPVRDGTKSNCNKDFVHHAGQVMRNVIIELWEVAGVWEANSLLNTLGFDSAMISLADLSNALSSELKLHRDVSTTGGTGEYIRLLKGALSLYQEEVRNLNSSLEHLSCERDKLRSDIIEANDRANLLAADVDEHQTRLEKNYQEQIRQLEAKHAEALKDLSNQLHSEREKSSSSLKTLEDQLHLLQQDEQRIKNELSTVLEEVKQLEQENQIQNDEILNLESCNSQLSIQVQELAAAHAQVESIETKENEQVSDLMAHIKRLQEEMKILRDNNDELTSELEMLKHRDNDAKSVVSSVDVRSTISDDNDGVVSMPTTEVSDTEDEDKQQSKPPEQSKVNKASDMMRNRINLDESSNGNSINKLTEIVQEFRNILTSAKFCTECSPLREEVSSLISELELYQSSIPISAPLPACNKKKKLRNLANELEAESKINQRPTDAYRDLVFTPAERAKHYKRISTSDDTIHDLLDDNIDDFCVKAMKNKVAGLRDYPPRSETDNNNKKEAINNLSLKKLNVQSKDSLNSEESTFALEKKVLVERCNELEKSLELLRSEYEQCEDYWASKLDEERQLFEQEQKVSDEKFAELIVKMTEYEEQFNITDKSNGRLSPIEEKFSLESQYNYLEEEFERWKMEAQEELEKKEKEIDELREKLDSGKKLSLADISVQFPDEDDPPNKYPELYNHLCSSSGSAGGGSDKVDSAIAPEAKSNSQPCHQCHKPVTQINPDCHDKSHQQQQQQQSQKKSHGKGEGKGSKRHNHHHQKRFDSDMEYKNLMRQKEKLKQEIAKLQSIKVLHGNPMFPLIGTEEQNIFSNLYAKMYAQDQKLKYMHFVCQAQQKDNQRTIHGMWRQHAAETNNLHAIIKSTENKLNQQKIINKELNDKLIKGDLLTKELFVENAQHLETIKRLEQHCQILTGGRLESTST